MNEDTSPDRKAAWIEHLRAEHGELISGRDLRKLLGYRDAGALGKAAQQAKAPVRLFKVAGRRDWFSLSVDVAGWLSSIGAKAPN